MIDDKPLPCTGTACASGVPTMRAMIDAMTTCHSVRSRLLGWHLAVLYAKSHISNTPMCACTTARTHTLTHAPHTRARARTRAHTHAHTHTGRTARMRVHTYEHARMYARMHARMHTRERQRVRSHMWHAYVARMCGTHMWHACVRQIGRFGRVQGLRQQGLALLRYRSRASRYLYIGAGPRATYI